MAETKHKTEIAHDEHMQAQGLFHLAQTYALQSRECERLLGRLLGFPDADEAFFSMDWLSEDIQTEGGTLDTGLRKLHIAVLPETPKPDLLAVVKVQHDAIDMLMAQLIQRDKDFKPSESPAWPAVLAGNAAIKAESA